MLSLSGVDAMISTRWLEKRKAHWLRLEELVKRSGSRGVSALAHREIQELGLLYRQTAADLAAVRDDPSGPRLAVYLNQLLARAHNLIYAGRREKAGGIVCFYRHAYPRIFRETASYTLFAFILFLLAAAAGSLLSLNDPEFPAFLLGPAMMRSIERQEMWTHSIVAIKPVASSAIATNNLAVAFMAFALGITAGIGTLYLMLFNGLLFGVVTTACWQAGMAGQLWAFVSPHGALELPAIFIAGGSGLLIARGLLFPGTLPRRDSLRVAGGAAVRLLLGVIPMLLIAGLIEGFVSPTALAAPFKFALGAALLVLLSAYLLRLEA